MYYFVRLEVTNYTGKVWNSYKPVVNGYKSTLIDIFTNRIIHQEISGSGNIASKHYVAANSISDAYYVYFYPLHCVDKSLLAYDNNMVPYDVLKRLYFKLNQVETKTLKLGKY